MKLSVESFKWALLVFALTYLPLWYNLGKPAIYIWDEASYANNSLEMAMHKDFLILKNNGEPTLYNVKPPLVIWFQCISIWLFGPDEWAIRFPSALAGFLTCLTVFFFIKRNFNPLTGLLAVLFLITTEGYVRHHMTRTGDLDSTLVFFVTAYTLLFLDFLLNKTSNRQDNRLIYLMGFLVFCAFMTKSVAGLIPLAGLFFGVFAVGKHKEVLSNKHFYFAGLATLALCLSYYAIRGLAQEGYLQKVWFSEYARFTDNIMPWLAATRTYYLTAMQEKLYKAYFWFLPLTFILLKNHSDKVRKTFIFGGVYCVTYLLLISYPNVKLDRYLAQVYPVFAILLGCTLYQVIQAIKRMSRQDWSTGIFAFPIALLVFSVPYANVLKRNADEAPVDFLEREAHTIKELSRKRPEVRNFKVMMKVEHPEHADAVNFYVKILNHYRNYEVRLTGDIGDLSVGDTVLCSQLSTSSQLNEHFEVDTLATFEQGLLMRLDQ